MTNDNVSQLPKASEQILPTSLSNGLMPMSNKLSIIIAGGGSIGTTIGVLLTREGHDVILLRKRGEFGNLVIEMVGVENLEQSIEVVNSKSLRTENDKITPHVIFLATQRQQLETQLDDLLELINFSNNPILVPLQNGLGTAQLICQWTRDHELNLPIIQAVIWWSATLHRPNLVLYHSKAITALGIPLKIACKNSSPQDLELIHRLLSPVFEINITDIDTEPYIKLILNVVSPVLALVKKPYPTGVNDMTVRKIIRLVIDEAMEIGKQQGWYIGDPRIENFHKLLSSDEVLEHYSTKLKLPIHKVSSQISAEKYGGKGSNVTELLIYFVNHGGKLCDKLLNVFMGLEPEYDAFEPDELLEKLTGHST